MRLPCTITFLKIDFHYKHDRHVESNSRNGCIVIGVNHNTLPWAVHNSRFTSSTRCRTEIKSMTRNVGNIIALIIGLYVVNATKRTAR